MPSQLPDITTPNSILVVSLVLVVLLLIVFFRKSVLADRVAAAAERRADAEAQRAAALEAAARVPAPQADIDDVAHLLDDLSGVLRVPEELDSPRAVAESLGAAIERMLAPDQWMVFADVEGDGVQYELLAAASKSGGTWPVGACLTPQMGRIGLVIRRKRMMERTEFLAEPPIVRDQVRESEPEIFQVDIAVPVFVRDRVVAAVSVGGSKRTLDLTRAALRLVASYGALLQRLKLATARAEQLENLDDATGLQNRNSFLARGGELLFQLRSNPAPVSCAVLGIDDFRIYVGREGPASARVLLRRVADLVGPCFRSSDLICRWGENDFAILMPGTDRAAARELVDRARHAVATTNLDGAENQPEGAVTLSAGLAVAPEDGATLDALVDHAYRAYLTSRERGGDRTSDEVVLQDEFLDAVADLADETPLRAPGDA